MQGVSRWEFIFVKLKSAKIAAGKSLAEKEETRTRPIEDALFHHPGKFTGI
jgi:hypothetical protein